MGKIIGIVLEEPVPAAADSEKDNEREPLEETFDEMEGNEKE